MTSLAVLSFYHEANTFSRQQATLAAYRAGGLHSGEELVVTYTGSRSTVGGYLSAARDAGVQFVPLLSAAITPCGPVSAEAFDTIVADMLSRLRHAGPFDGVLLGLHGACVAEGHPSADAEIAEAVRAVVGPDVPIGCVVDMHANLSQRLVDALDVLLAYQTNPHVDPSSRAELCCRLVLEMAAGAPRPVMTLERLPLVVPIVRQDTSLEPMAGLLATARQVAAESGAVDISVVEGFPYADVEQMGMSVLAVHRDADASRSAAARVAAAVWERRHELQGSAMAIGEAFDRLAEHRGDKPLLMLDIGDNIGGGAPGDSTLLLAEAIARRSAGFATTLADPVAVASVAELPIGARVTVTAGAWSPDRVGEPVTLTGTLVGRHDGVYETATVAHGGFRYFDGGAMRAVTTDEGIHVVLTSKAVQAVTPAQFRVVGLEPTAFRAVAAKGVNAPRAGYAGICSGILEVETRGVTQNRVQEFRYEHRMRPMFPFEADAVYPPLTVAHGAAL